MQLRTTQFSLEGDEALSLDLELERTEDGRKVYRMKRAMHAARGILPGLPAQLFAPFSFRSLPRPAEGGEPVERAAGSEGVVEGVASSTSVDWYGTEMDRDALDSMALQFTAGVALTPRHNGWFDPVEWDEVIGLTMEASVRPAEVVNAADPTEQGYTLSIRANLYPDEEKAKALQRRLASGQPIGLSIGGWFTDVRFITAQDSDEVERIIILAVKLDHVAVTRAPANPDSIGMKLMRAMGDAAVKALRVAQAPEAQPEPVAQPEARTAPEPEPAPQVEPPVAPTPIALSAPEVPAPAPVAAEEGRGTGAPDSTPPTGNPVENLAPPAPSDDSTSNRSVPPTPDPEATMTPEQLRAILDEKMGPLSQRLDAIEAARSAPAPAAAPAAPAAPAVDWEARAKAAERENAVLAQRIVPTASGRRSMVPDHAFRSGDGEGSEFRSLVQLARTEGRALAVAAASERHAVILTADKYEPKVTRSHLEMALRDLVNSAIGDGLIKDPSGDPVWG